jgi:hypothetical protein
MSLPASQQRVLDEIGNGLRASEPRLAGMFAIFTRLNLGEPPPRREELPLRRGRLSLMASPRHDDRAQSSRAAGRRSRRSPILALIACYIAATLAIAGLLVGLTVRSAPKSCLIGLYRGIAVTHVPTPGCRAQAGP